MKYVDAEKLIAEIDSRMGDCKLPDGKFPTAANAVRYEELSCLRNFITSLQQEQPANMIQWTGSNLQKVIDFTGKSPRFGEWFNSWEEYESYVHSHGDILKLFSEDGSHFEVPVGAWIVKTPDGYNVPSVARFIHAKQEQHSLPSNLDEAADAYSENILANGEDMFDAIADGFRAGAEWIAGQGVNTDFEVCKLANRAWLTPIDEKRFMQDVYGNFAAGDKVVVQIRKK